jgi:hypothetical protein
MKIKIDLYLYQAVIIPNLIVKRVIYYVKLRISTKTITKFFIFIVAELRLVWILNVESF